MEHLPILLDEVIDALNIKVDGIYVDATYGRGGHSKAILSRLGQGKLIVVDQDPMAIASAMSLAKEDQRVIVVQKDFASLKNELNALDIQTVDGILMDIGVSSPQFDDQSRGFSYRLNARLDMRMNTLQVLDAWKVVNEYEFEKLVYIFKRFGEEKFSKEIARKIEQARAKKSIDTTFELVDVIKSALPMKVLALKGHPAKQIFQAIRIEVNQELKQLETALKVFPDLLNKNGRLAIISFHSLEDRMIKQSFIQRSQVDLPSKLPIQNIDNALFALYSKKAIVPSEKEIKENPRAHSAKLRVLVKK